MGASGRAKVLIITGECISTSLRFVVLGFWLPALILFSPVHILPALIKDSAVRPTELQRACVENKSPLGDAALVELARRS